MRGSLAYAEQSKSQGTAWAHAVSLFLYQFLEECNRLKLVSKIHFFREAMLEIQITCEHTTQIFFVSKRFYTAMYCFLIKMYLYVLIYCLS